MFYINTSFEEEYLRISPKGTVSGQISVSVNDVPFPSLYWNDLVTKVLEMWANSAREIVEGRSVVDFPFMDGSYEFIARRIPDNKVHLACYEDYKETELSVEVGIKEFATEISKCIKKLNNFLERKGWKYDNQEHLKRAYKLLEEELKNI